MIKYNGNLPWLVDRTVIYGRHGSHAYGLNIATSDEDFKGVCIPPPEYRNGFLNHFEQAESKVPDTVIYDIRKFMSLAAECNPNIIEVLWSDHMIVTPIGEELISNRDLFLSQKAKHTFSGYAMAQLKRIKTHYKWLKNPPKVKPSRADFNLPEETVISADQLAAAETVVKEKMNEWNVDWLGDFTPDMRISIQDRMAKIIAEMQISEDQQFTSAARQIGLSDGFIRVLQSEKEYNARKREWDQYNNWKANRNPTRAALEEKFGYNTKHAMHLVRLMRMCKEIISEGRVIVKRPDREELLEIRSGKFSYDELVEWAANADVEISKALAKSPLRKSPDRAALDQLCVSLIEKHEEIFKNNDGKK